MDRPDLDAIEARLKAATPTDETHPDPDEDWCPDCGWLGVDFYPEHTKECEFRPAEVAMHEAYKALVASAPTDLSALLAHARRLEAPTALEAIEAANAALAGAPRD